MIKRVDKEISEALKGGDKKRANALKMLKNALMVAEKNKAEKLSEEETFKIIRKEINMRIESRDLYAENNRQELADNEEYERSLFSQYLPTDLSQAQLEEIIDKNIKLLSDEPKFSELMPAVMKEVSGRADGRMVVDLVRKSLEMNNK